MTVRYKLEIDVSYDNTKATFVLWDREVTQLLGISAAQLRSNMIQVYSYFSYLYYCCHVCVHNFTLQLIVVITGWDN
jgi:hypothetical protein